MSNKTILKKEPAVRKEEQDPPPATLREGTCININPPFRGEQYAANLQLTKEDLARLEKAIPETERLLFVIVGDLNILGGPCHSSRIGVITVVGLGPTRR